MAGIPLKHVWWEFIKQGWFWAPIAGIGSWTITCWKFNQDENIPLWIFLIQGLVFFAFVFPTFCQWRERQRERQCHEIEGCLYTLYWLLRLSVPSKNSSPRLRITVHVISKDETHFVQLLNYIGGRNKKKTKGRKHPMGAGAIGQCAKNKEATVGSRENDNVEQYVHELVQKEGFARETALKMDMTTMSWMAVPIFIDEYEEDLIAVLYLDSVDPQFFTKPRRTIIINASTGIARFLKQLYF